MGRALAEARRLSATMQQEVSKVMAEPRQVMAQVMEESGLNSSSLDGASVTGPSVTGQSFNSPPAPPSTP